MRDDRLAHTGPGGGTNTAAGSPRRPDRSLLAVLAALTAMGPISIDLYLPALPQLSQSMAASPAQAQFTLTACLVGLAVGQLVGGPTSDTWGRRRTLVAGSGSYALTSLLCAVAPSIGALVGMRLAQGLAGGVCLAVSRALVGDRYQGSDAARVLSALMALAGAAPILAPLIGAQVLRVGSWRADFAVVGALGVLIYCATIRYLPRTGAGRPPASGRGVMGSYRRLCRDRVFVGNLLTAGLSFAAMFVYIAASPFVLEHGYGLSPQGYAVDFAVNGAGIVVFSWLGVRCAGRVPTGRLLAAGLSTAAIGSMLLLLASLTSARLAPLLAGLFLVASSIGLIVPNASARALAGHRARDMGTASGLLGSCQFLFGGLAAAVAKSQDGLAMAAAIAILVASAALSHFVATANARRAAEGHRLTRS